MSISAKAILAAFLWLPATSVVAQDIFPYRFEIDDFPNGLRLITVPTEFSGIVSTQIIVSTGSRNEVEPGRSGFAHFFEHIMFRGTENFSSAQQANVFKRAGADRNAFTTDDFTNYHTTVPTEELAMVLEMEADRFQHLSYSPEVFRTEAMAVFGEYNKNSSNPLTKLIEVIRNTAFDQHTYKHTTMGFLADIQAMPDQYEYSLEFFDRWYRPENTTILVVGDVERDYVWELVAKYWGGWKRGSFVAEIPQEAPQKQPLSCHVDWPSPTQPWVVVAFKGPAFSPDQKDMPTLDVLSALAFAGNSELFKKLFLRERRVDALFASFPDHSDPYLLMVFARLRDPKDWGIVRDEILATCESLKHRSVDAAQLKAVKANLKYSFAGTLDSSDAIAAALAGYIARTHNPDSLNKVYRLYDGVTAADIKAMAKKYFVTSSRTVGTLSHGVLPKVLEFSDAATKRVEQHPRSVLQPSSSPLVSFRLLYECGAADDPEGKEGLAYLTANLIAQGATAKRSLEDIVEALYPLAATVSVQVDKEMTVISGIVHKDNLDAYKQLLMEMLTEPGFDESDLARLKANTISYIDVGLRRGDDEEVGKEVMYAEIYANHPYGHLNAGLIESITKIGIEDVRGFYRHFFVEPNLVLGLSGDYPETLPKDLRRSIAALGGEARAKVKIPAPEPIQSNRMTIIEKNTRATGIHIGLPIEVTRAHPDWVALWLVRSFFGEHRSENSYLYQRLREIRGLNYGDYAYIEYFPRGGQQFHPDANNSRRQQIFQIWIRPVPPANGPFAFKAAYYELQKLVKNGLSRDDFESTRGYLSKFVNLLVKSQDRQLGYALDSRYYGTGEFAKFVKQGLDALTIEGVNAAIRRHLRAERLQFVVVTKDAAGFKQRVLGDEPTPIEYQAQPPAAILAEDKIIESIRVPIHPARVKIIPVERVFKERR